MTETPNGPSRRRFPRGKSSPQKGSAGRENKPPRIGEKDENGAAVFGLVMGIKILTAGEQAGAKRICREKECFAESEGHIAEANT